jgi:molybdopterin-synthase adenylyltransferase
MQTFDDCGIAGDAAASGAAASRLAAASVLVAGVGALGSAAALQLAAAGIARLVLMDPDVLEPSNLHRQIVHRSPAIGRPKVESAREFLARRFTTVLIETRCEALGAGNWEAATAGVTFIIDATDGAAAKFLINDAAVAASRPFSHAGVAGLRGQTTTVLPGDSACLRCLFPDPPADGAVPTCQEAGVVGTVAGVIGFLQASEAIRFLSGRRPLLADRLLTYEARSGRWRQVPLVRNASCAACSVAGEHKTAGRTGAPRNGADA